MSNQARVCIPCSVCDGIGGVLVGAHTDETRTCSKCLGHGFRMVNVAQREIHVGECYECDGTALHVDADADTDGEGGMRDTSTRTCLACGSTETSQSCRCNWGGDCGTDPACAAARAALSKAAA